MSQLNSNSLVCEDETDDSTFVEELDGPNEGLRKKMKIIIPEFQLSDFQKGGPYFGVKVHTHCLPPEIWDDINKNHPTFPIWKEDFKKRILEKLHCFLPLENRVKCACELEVDNYQPKEQEEEEEEVKNTQDFQESVDVVN